jgi:UDP-N-acetylmuramoyl-L-alanyl-D-glutamate--2,6-diaminopimelate ligase
VRLSELLAALSIAQVSGSVDIDVTGFSMDSRKAEPGNMFVALTEPELADRRQFVPAACEAGATSVLVAEPLPCEARPPGLTQIVVPDVQVASALMAARFYGEPAKKLSMIGVTGTKGKTTTTYLVAAMLERAGLSTGLIGTVHIKYGSTTERSPNSTPHAVELQRILARMAAAGVSAVTMEVSSHALRLHRVSAIPYRVGVFTNLGGDHMNFHTSVEDYAQAKSMLMSLVIVDGKTVVNIDDPRGEYMRASSLCECYTYGLSKQAAIWASDVKTSLAGSSFTLHCPSGTRTVKTQLPGKFNVYNALAAAGAAMAMGVPLDAIVEALAETRGVPGRMEGVDTEGLGFRVIVDYAHTAESMENVLQTLRNLNPRKLITVFGCGGDRDRTRRPKMGRVAVAYSDKVFITSDNPRTESPRAIIQDILAGFGDQMDPGAYTVVEDRAEAIRQAIKAARPGDIVAILGKGHEDYQIIGHERIHFDDREVAQLAVDELRPAY